jgi:hypothetical protein
MDLKDRRAKKLAELQRNRADIIKHEQMLDALNNGAIHLKAQIMLLDEMLKEQEAEEKANEKVPSNVQSPPVASPASAPVRSEHADEANTGHNSGSGQ